MFTVVFTYTVNDLLWLNSLYIFVGTKLEISSFLGLSLAQLRILCLATYLKIGWLINRYPSPVVLETGYQCYYLVELYNFSIISSFLKSLTLELSLL